MSAVSQEARSPGGGLASSENRENIVYTVLKILGLMLLNAFGLVLVYSMLTEGDVGLGVVIAIITIGLNIIIFVPALFPLRWMSPGLALITLLVIYPVIFTVQTAFTNYGDSHLFPKDSAIALISDRGYVPDNARTFSFRPYFAGEDDYALWLTDNQTGEVFFAQPGEAIEPVSLETFGVSIPGTPASNGFTELDQPGPLIGAQVEEFTFAEPVGTVVVSMTSPQNVDTDAQYVFQPTSQTLYNRETGESVQATILQRGNEFGLYWEAPDGTTYLARPGEPVYVNNLPSIEGYDPVDSSALIEAGLETLSFNDPLGEVQIRELDPLTQDDFGTYSIYPALIFDPVQGLTIDRETGNVFNTTTYVNPAGEYAFWLTEVTASDVRRGFVILPGQNRREVDISDRRLLRQLDIDLTTGTVIPNSIQTFERTTVGEDLVGLEYPDVIIGFEVETFDFDAGFVYDPAQGLTINYSNGVVYETTLYQNADGEFAVWIDSDSRELSVIDTILARPGQVPILDGAPLEYEGYRLALSNLERSNATIFLQEIEVDYFGTEDAPSNERIGIVPGQYNTAGQPYLLRYIYNDTEDAFFDIASIDATTLNLDDLNLETNTPYTVDGLLSMAVYRGNDVDGFFDPTRLRMVYNESVDAYLDLFSINVSNLGDISGEDIATQDPASIPGLENASRFTQFAEPGIFAPVGYVYNATANAFINTNSADVDPAAMETATLDELGAIDGLVYFVFNETTELYISPEWVYNETSDTFFDVSDLDMAALDLEGIDLSGLNPDSVDPLSLESLTLYDFFEEQNVYTPQGFVYNEPANAFVDVDSIPSSVDVTGIDIATADLTAEEFRRADIYFFDEETGIYVTPRYIYNRPAETYVDTNRLPDEVDLEGVNLEEDNLFEIEGLENIQLVSVDLLREPLLYGDQVDPVLNTKIDAYIYVPDVDTVGIDLETYNPETLTTFGTETPAPINPLVNSPRISPLVYSSTLRETGLNPDRYILGVDNSISSLSPGYRVNIGTRNFTQLVEDRRLLSPLIDIFIWNVTFALLSVFTTFAVGLFMALILNDDGIPGRKIIRSLLIIPYAIPGVIGILVWQGMLNQNLGIITNTVADTVGVRIPWFTDPTWAKIAIVVVNLWLGYPYMMLICSGALQAIPSDVYEAAAVDGARPMQRFWNITLPLLLVTVGPLLIASFTFNFNNYLMIELLTRGDPPIPGTPTPAGYTDILISYTYNLAFGTDRGADYGYASAITIVIFALVAVVTLFQYRFTRQWEEVGENV
ncbi:MAG: ABC transporter permease subunit [Chloroflexota bacterium]